MKRTTQSDNFFTCPNMAPKRTVPNLSRRQIDSDTTLVPIEGINIVGWSACLSFLCQVFSSFINRILYIFIKNKWICTYIEGFLQILGDWEALVVCWFITHISCCSPPYVIVLLCRHNHSLIIIIIIFVCAILLSSLYYY